MKTLNDASGSMFMIHQANICKLRFLFVLNAYTCTSFVYFSGYPFDKHDKTIHDTENKSCLQVYLVAKWLRSLIFSTLKRSSSHRCGFEPSSGHM